MATDLHIHSSYSSGTQTPAEAIQEAISKGITFISFTDDDTMDAYQELDDLAQKYGITYIKGAQISASHNNQLFRLLAYDCNPQNKRLQVLFQENLDSASINTPKSMVSLVSGLSWKNKNTGLIKTKVPFKIRHQPPNRACT